MKKPIFNSQERGLLIEKQTLSGAILEIKLQVLHLCKSLDKSILLKPVHATLNWLEKTLPKTTK